MAGSIRGRAGGILAVLELIDEGHGPALEADLITHGMPALHTAGTPALPWHTVFIFARRMQEVPGTALGVSVHGPRAQWTVAEQLLSKAVNSLQWLVWSKSKDASQPGAKPPEPRHLPGLEPVDEDTKHRGTPTPIGDVIAMLGPQAQALYPDLV